MRNKWKLVLLFGVIGMLGLQVCAQDQQNYPVPSSSVIKRSIKAIGYSVGGGVSRVIFIGTQAAPAAQGEAKVQAKQGVTNIELKVSNMPQPTTLGTELLTYVLWAISPDGRSINLGEVLVDKQGQAQLKATTQLQTFSMIVTAEPYFAVRIPSEIVVLENDTTKSTKGKIYPNNDYTLMQRSQYAKMGNPLALTVDLKTTPLDVYEARNALDIARSQKADMYAPEIFGKAVSSLQMTENELSSKANKKQIRTNARQTVQFAEDARALSAERQDAERIQRERQDAAARAAAGAKAQADAQAAAEAQRQAELTAAKEAQMKAEADAAAARAQANADAAAARAQADADATAAKNAAEQATLQAREQAARDAADKAQRDAAALRAQLLAQFNQILQTTDTPRGLVVNMADVLFDTAKYNLRMEAREKLAKLTGIVLAHPGLHLAVEGYTDSTGSDEFNMKLSDQRASTVRDYLVSQGLAADQVTSQGFGPANPVADNGTAAGRQKNRRVEIIVSGEVIGQKIGN